MQENLCKISSCPGQNLFPDDTEQGFQFLFGGIPAQGNPEGTVDHIGIYLHGIQHMAPVTLGAGTAGGHTDAVILQDVDGILGGNTGDADIQHMGGGMRAVQMNARQGGQLLGGILQQFLLFFDILFERSACRKWCSMSPWPRCRP